jgi:DNA-binding MarR family transcriptional regulator
VLREHGLCYEDVVVLATTLAIGKMTLFPSQARIARETVMSEIAVSRSLCRLERGGFVRRRFSGCDERVRRSWVTPAGRDLLAMCESEFAVLRRELFGDDAVACVT